MGIDRSKRLTKLYLPEKEGDSPLKRSKTGYELEGFILDEEGNLTDATHILKAVEKKKDFELQKESGKAMVELICMPYQRLRSTAHEFLRIVSEFAALCENEGCHFYPFGTYPGLNRVGVRMNDRLKTLETLFGEEILKSTKVSGFHQHYTLPRGTFDEEEKFLQYMPSSKVKRTLIDSYNILTAMDPIICLFLQSSPYIGRKNLAKDSRLLIWRGGTNLGHGESGYVGPNYSLTHLTPYKQTLKDLIAMQKKQNQDVRDLMKEKNMDMSKAPPLLDFTWNPVKVNRHGTLECRSGDSNYLSLIFGVSAMIKFTLRKIQQDFTLVTPMDIEIEDAFKVENDMIFIPPQSVVRSKLQYDAAYKGFESEELTTYASNFLRFIKKHVITSKYRSNLPFLKPIEEMMERKKTVSDEMLERAKKNGFEEDINQDYAREMALHYSKKFMEDIEYCWDEYEDIF